MQGAGPQQDQGGPRSVDPFLGIGSPPTDKSHFPGRHSFIRIISPEEKKSILEKLSHQVFPRGLQL